MLTRSEGPGHTVGLAPRGVNAGNGFLFVSHRGEVFPSGFLPLPAGNVRERRLAPALPRAETFRALRDPDRLEGRCGRCEFREICGGSRSRAFALTGDPFATDPWCAYEPRTASSSPSRARGGPVSSKAWSTFQFAIRLNSSSLIHSSASTNTPWISCSKCSRAARAYSVTSSGSKRPERIFDGELPQPRVLAGDRLQRGFLGAEHAHEGGIEHAVLELGVVLLRVREGGHHRRQRFRRGARRLQPLERLELPQEHAVLRLQPIGDAHARFSSPTDQGNRSARRFGGAIVRPNVRSRKACGAGRPGAQRFPGGVPEIRAAGALTAAHDLKSSA